MLEFCHENDIQLVWVTGHTIQLDNESDATLLKLFFGK